MAAKRALTAREVGAELRRDRQTILRWARDGCPHDRRSQRSKPILFNVAEVRAWLKAENRTGAPGRPATDVGLTEKAARVGLMNERRLLLEQKRQIQAGKVHDVMACKARRLRQIHAVKNRLLIVPRTVADVLRGLDAEIVEAVKARCREEVLAAVEEFGGGNKKDTS